MSESSSEQIIRELFDELFHQLVFTSYHYVKDYDQAEEIVQDVFVKVWQNFDKIESVLDKKGYLFRAVKNSSLNFLKHVKVRKRYVEEEKAQGLSFEHSPEEKFSREETRKQVHAAVDKLPPNWKEALILSKYRNLTYREIAEQMDISQKTVEKYISKAYAFLRTELKDLLVLGLVILEIFFSVNSG